MNNQPTSNMPVPPQQQSPLPQQDKEKKTNRKLKKWNIIVAIIDVILLLLLIFWPKHCNRDDIDVAVEEAGGNTGYMGMKLVWNDDGQHIRVDFDAHAAEPNGEPIFWNRHNKNHGGSPTSLGGYLDVDMLHNHYGTCAENILWPSKERLADGVYEFVVNNYKEPGCSHYYDAHNRGFKAKIYVGNKTFTYIVNQDVAETVQIADVTIRNGELANIKHYIQPQQ